MNRAAGGFLFSFFLVKDYGATRRMRDMCTTFFSVQALTKQYKAKTHFAFDLLTHVQAGPTRGQTDTWHATSCSCTEREKRQREGDDARRIDGVMIIY